MAAKGAIVKEQVAQKILETFPGAFKYEKEIRIPMMENGEMLQIKVALTAAKNMVDAGGDTAMPGTMAATPAPAQLKRDAVVVEPTAEETANVKNLMNLLGL